MIKQSGHSLNRMLSYITILLFSIIVFGTFYNGIYSLPSVMVCFILLIANLSVGYVYKILPSAIFTILTTIMFVFSGQVSVRGFNAPLNHWLKFVYLLTAFFMAFSFSKLSDKRKRTVVKVIIGLLLLGAVMSIYYCTVINSYAVRNSLYSEVLSFDAMYCIPILVTALTANICNAKNKKVKRLEIFVLIILVVTSAASLLTTCFILTIMAVAMPIMMQLFAKYKKTAIISVVLMIIALLLVIIFSDPIASFLYSLTENLNWILRSRLSSIIDLFFATNYAGGYSYDRRTELAGYSLNSFAENILVGVGYKGYRYGTIGCHQEWQDLLGVFGLCGTSLFIIVFFVTVRRIYSNLVEKIDKDSFIYAIIIFLVLGILNPCMNLNVLIILFMVVPNLSLLFDKGENKIEQ